MLHTATDAREARPSHYWANTEAWTTCASRYATRGDARSTRRGTDTRSGDRLPDQRHVRDRAILKCSRRCCSDALESCPGGDDRKRAPWHCVRHGGCAERHRRDRVNLRPAEAHGQSRSVTLLDIRHADHRVSAQPCRAQALSMPAGPATAGAERSDAHGRRRARRETRRRDGRRPVRRVHVVHIGGATLLPEHTPTHCDTRHGQAWRERPRQGAWGHPQGTAWGSFTPWLVQDAGRLSVSRAAHSAARPIARPS